MKTANTTTPKQSATRPVPLKIMIGRYEFPAELVSLEGDTLILRTTVKSPEVRDFVRTNRQCAP
jgi:hypothetical protein